MRLRKVDGVRLHRGKKKRARHERSGSGRIPKFELPMFELPRSAVDAITHHTSLVAGIPFPYPSGLSSPSKTHLSSLAEGLAQNLQMQWPEASCLKPDTRLEARVTRDRRSQAPNCVRWWSRCL